MNFSLNEEQGLLRDSVRQFASKAYAFEGRKALLHDAAAQKAVWREIVNLGWTAIALPEEFGGIGDVKELAVVAEELGRCLYVGPFLSSTVLGGQLLAACEVTAQREDLLGQMIDGQVTVAVAYSEESSRGAIERIVTRAKKDGEGYVLEGRKTLVLGANGADKLIVSALLADARGQDQVGLFLVDATADGVQIFATRLLDGSDAADVELSAVRVPDSALLAGDGAAALTRALGVAIVTCCAEAIGLMSQATDCCTEYAGIRKQFGRVLSEFQAIQHRIADMVIETETLRAALHAALAAFERPDEGARHKALATAKMMSGTLGRWVCGHAIQLHGGIGMAEEHIVGHFFRRINVIEACFGNGLYHLGEAKRQVRRELDQH